MELTSASINRGMKYVICKEIDENGNKGIM